MILVDDIHRYKQGPRGWLFWCHMASDDLSEAGLEELHRMASAIGLKRAWFQNHPRHPHYDLLPESRRLALAAGALPVTSRELVKRCSKKLGESYEL